MRLLFLEPDKKDLLLTVANGGCTPRPALMSEAKPRSVPGMSWLEPLSAGGNDRGGRVSVGGTIGTWRATEILGVSMTDLMTKVRIFIPRE